LFNRVIFGVDQWSHYENTFHIPYLFHVGDFT
jgi:hypothetical protein